MVKMHLQGKPPFIRSQHVQDGDLAAITEPPYIVDAEKSKFGKERTVVTVKLRRTGDVFRWSLNTTTNDRLVDKFGEEGELWKGKEVKIQKRSEVVRGEERWVLYAVPSTQMNLQPPAVAGTAA